MPTLLPSVAAVRLLAVLCVTAGCAVAEQQQLSVVTIDTTTDELWCFLEQAVWAKLQPLVSRLESRMDALAIRLESRMDQLATRLESRFDVLDNKLESRVDALDDKLRLLDWRVHALASRLDRQQSQLAVLNKKSRRQKSQLNRAVNKTASQKTQIDELAVRLDQVEGEVGPGGSEPLPQDCSELPAGARSGIHMLQPGMDRSLPPVEAYCDLVTDGGRWTVFQRRANIEPHQDFYLGWAAYKEGFGELRGEFWWGLESLWRMTAAPERQYELRIEMESFDGDKGHALYQNFRISSEEDGYRLSADSYIGDAGDSLSWNANRQFSTHDRDQDGNPGASCAQYNKAAWWYDNSYCGDSDLNGPHQNGTDGREQITWTTWKGLNSLKKAEMKLRRV